MWLPLPGTLCPAFHLTQMPTSFFSTLPLPLASLRSHLLIFFLTCWLLLPRLLASSFLSDIQMSGGVHGGPAPSPLLYLHSSMGQWQLAHGLKFHL